MTEKATPSSLLSLIRGAETSRGYDDYSRYAKLAPPKPVSQMTVNEVRNWQQQAIRAGSKSVAVGGYQFISKTFDGVVSELGLTGDELFDQSLQDRMGTQLLARRGYNKWAQGQITDEQFADNLSMEWAALPRFTGPKRGRSHYDKDGLNASRVGIDVVQQALAASRNGEIIDFAGAPAGGARSPLAPTPAETERRLTLENVDPNASYTGADMAQIGATPTKTYRDSYDDRAAAQAAKADKPGFWEGALLAAEEGQMLAAAFKQLNREDFLEDTEFQRTGFTQEQIDEIAGHLPKDYQMGLGAAVSIPHAKALAEELTREYEIDRKLGEMGAVGVGLRLGTAILDPVAIAASVASEGALAPVIYGAKVTKVGRFLRAGVAAGAVNAGIETYLTSQNAHKEWENVAYAAAAGFVLGGAFGAFRKTPEDPRIAATLNDFVQAHPDVAAARAAARGANDGSLGAARPDNLPPPALSPAETVRAQAADAPMSALGRLRIDVVGRLKQSPNGVTRKLAALLGEDGVGNANGAVNVRAASENVARDMRVRLSRFYRTYDDSFAEWSKEQGLPWYSRGAAHRANFNNAVGMAVRRELDAGTNTHVQRVAATIKDEFKDLLEFGRDHNIRGFNDIKDNYNYMARRFRIQALDDLVRDFDEGPVHGLVAKSLMDANKKWRNRNPNKAMGAEELEYEDALKISEAYIKSIRSRKYGEFDLNRALSGQNTEVLQDMLLDSGMDATQAGKIVDAVRFSVDTSEKGRISNAKWRLDIDETTRVRMQHKDGTWHEKGIEDFLENDAELLFTNYARSVIGAGHLEDAFSNFKVPDADGNMPAHAPSYQTIRGYIAAEAQAKNVSQSKMAKEFRRLDNLHKAVAGIPLEPSTGFREFLRVLRDYNFIRIGGQLGIAQLGELGNIIGNGGVRVFLQHMPALRSIFRSAKRKFSDEFFNEIEAIWGFGTDLLRSSPHVKMDDVHGSTFEGRGGESTRFQKADHLLQQGKIATSVTSGMAHTNMVLQRLNARILVQRFMDNATGRREINVKRLRSMGFDDGMIERVNAQMLKHVDQATGLLGRKVSRINIDKWDDLNAKNAFINGVDRWAKKSVQENDVGNMPDFTDFVSHEMGKTLTQFRSFMLAAYTKQLLSGIHHWDWETFSSWATSMFFGGLVYVGQQHINAIGRGDREEWLEERLTNESIAKAAFQRAAFSSLIPLGVDTLTGAGGFEPVFAFRTTDLGSSILGNPTYDLIKNMQRGAQGIAAPLVNPDYEFSKQDYRAITSTFFMQNAFVVRNVIAALGSDLPNYSQ